MEERPSKKQRVDKIVDKKDEWDPLVLPGEEDAGVKYTLEADVGITEFVNHEFEGFDCILKYRYILTEQWS